MPQSIVIYTRFGAYEPGNRYYLANPPAGAAQSIAAGLAGAQARIQTTNVSIVRYEVLDATGAKIGEGSLAQAGLVLGEFSEFAYCAYIRFNSAGPQRPSSKYVHGFPESAVANGIPTSTWLTSVAAYGSDLAGFDVTDSDGEAITSVTFRRGSRRKNVRVAP